MCNVAVEVPNEGGDDDEENYWQFLIFLLFQGSFPRYIVLPTIQHAGLLWAKGEKKYVYVYRNRVYLIFHDTNNPIIMTRLLFSIIMVLLLLLLLE